MNHMRLLFIGCSRRACELMNRTAGLWLKSNPADEIICKVKCRSLPDISEEKSLTECVGEWFDKEDALVFFGAAGIAVRCIAPYLGHKSTDPAVIVIDESGSFCISLLSGHVGGANQLTRQLSELLEAVPVITTATDREGKFAVDEFARRNGLVITDWKKAKEISARILEGETIGLLVDAPFRLVPEGEVPEQIQIMEAEGKENFSAEQSCAQSGQNLQAGVFISPCGTDEQPFPLTLQLIPKMVTVGIGCRRNISREKIAQAVESCLSENHILGQAVCKVASIDLKSREEGLLAYCQEKGLPFLTFSSKELEAQDGEFTGSGFVKQITGVENVCERSAVAASGGKLLCGKRIYDGVTVALAAGKGRITF